MYLILASVAIVLGSAIAAPIEGTPKPINAAACKIIALKNAKNCNLYNKIPVTPKAYAVRPELKNVIMKELEKLQSNKQYTFSSEEFYETEQAGDGPRMGNGEQNQDALKKACYRHTAVDAFGCVAFVEGYNTNHMNLFLFYSLMYEAGIDYWEFNGSTDASAESMSDESTSEESTSEESTSEESTSEESTSEESTSDDESSFYV